ncbi:MAG: polysaccharide biosynthesis tyrosine autokinase [Ignavibacteriota bacterium]|nr:polysaccharide biosynthesis tyrosine autokinase [Ignavibacteriota bacterium]MCZ2270188.1 polysaccharide biosynthesis tyrosine autokinase [Ignavibacteriales bacterium]QKJ98228.1 MAG: polysaccharide biosynthesis tyrosine autokinase [Ignavibacteriota bacterium]HOJ07530.1 polysaccharide biosynthesis tyrosine autokinase [Ignavibacteriaceae bacterium]
MIDNISKSHKKEKSLLELIYIIYKGKWIIISIIIASVILAFTYNQLTTPIYESKALLKKEVTDNSGQRDELYEIVKLQTSDRLETEMELVKTSEVLGRVIRDLKLRFDVKKIVDPKGNSYHLKNVFVDFPDSGNNYAKEISFSLPKIKYLKIKDENTELELFIKKIATNKFELWDVEKNKLIISFNVSSVSKSDSLIESNIENSFDLKQELQKNQNQLNVNTDFLQFDFSWDDAPVGSKIYFDIENYSKFYTTFSKDINVSRIGHTDVFELSIKSSSPLACKIIADDLINQFREVRMEQQKQSVRYSYNFIDEQLTEVQKKLIDSEGNLSNFKGSGRIINIDQNTQELLNYQSTLEAEKLQTDLLLSNYRDKAAAMQKELEASGYFDQSFLQPSGENQGESPFSGLMSRLSELELQKLDLMQKRTEKHPDVININEQIELVKQKLSSYNQNTLTAYKIIIGTLEKKLYKINSLLSLHESEIKQLPAKETQMARLIREKDVYEKMFKLLLDKREEMRVAELAQLQDIIIVDHPYKPLKPIQPRKLLNMLIGLALGGFIGILTVFIIELRKTNLIDLDYLEDELKLPLLALIPSFDKSILNRMKKSNDEKDKFVTLNTDDSGINESYRLLNTKLSHLDLKGKTIMVTSCEENTGKTTIVANLAITMALNDKNILIIDCDLRKGELSKLFNVFNNSSGLIDFLEKGTSPVIYTKILKKINIIPSGGLRENSSILLSSDRMKSIFEKINTSAYDYVIIDTPPVTRVVDTLVLGQYITNALLIVRPETSMKDSVIGGIQDMKQAKIKILGIVANATDIQNSYRYRYSYGYGYGYGHGNNHNQGNKNSRNRVKKDSSIIQKDSKVNSV